MGGAVHPRSGCSVPKEVAVALTLSGSERVLGEGGDGWSSLFLITQQPFLRAQGGPGAVLSTLCPFS